MEGRDLRQEHWEAEYARRVETTPDGMTTTRRFAFTDKERFEVEKIVKEVIAAQLGYHREEGK